MSASAGETQQLDWSRLIDQSAQDYDDPYRELSPEQLASLVSVARLREKAEKGESIDEERLVRETASLAEDGIDIDGLIAQRWTVAERRERAATSGNKAVDGREVVAGNLGSTRAAKYRARTCRCLSLAGRWQHRWPILRWAPRYRCR